MNKACKRTLIFILLSTLLSVLSLGAEPVDGRVSDYLGRLNEAELGVFKSEGMIFRYDEEKKGPVYLPESGFAADVSALHDRLAPEVMVEALYYIEYPANFPTDTDEIKSVISRLTHKVSTISGAMYFSRTEQDFAVLFEDVYAIDNMRTKKPVPDPATFPAGGGDNLIIHMDEHSMGRGYYRMDYLEKSGELAIELTNLSPMSKIIKAVDTGDMKIFLQLIPCSDGLLVYGYCGVVLQNDALVNLLLDPYYSFYRRMTAMETWLYNILHDSDRLPPLTEPMP